MFIWVIFLTIPGARSLPFPKKKKENNNNNHIFLFLLFFLPSQGQETRRAQRQAPAREGGRGGGLQRG